MSYFDDEAATRAVTFIEKFCKHSKGKFATKPLTLLPWQDQLIRTVFGTKRDDTKKRQYRQVGIWIPRRNGKTTLMAALSLFMLLADGEKGPEVYIIANTLEQAELCWSTAVAMIRQCPAIDKRLKIYKARRRIVDESNFGKLLILSSETNANLGQNASAIIFDELAFFAKREMYTNLRSSQLNREQPLLFTISTASNNLSGIGKEQYDYAVSVRDGKIEDDTFLPVIYEAPLTMDWKDASTWRIANPSMGTAFNESELAQLCKEAQNEPRKQYEFETFHLNRWIGNAVAWLPMTEWFACKEPNYPNLQGKNCFLGLDMARTGDLASYVMVFPIGDNYYLLPRFFLPEARIEDKQLKDKAPYVHWAQKGYLTLVEGNVISDAAVREAIIEDSKKYKIQQIGYDTCYAHSLCAEQLGQEEGFEVIPIRQGMISMGPPTAAFERLVKSQRIKHNNNPVLNWNVENASVVADRNDNIMVTKMHNNERRKVDGLVASIMGLCLAMKVEDDSPQIFVFSHR